MRVMGEFPIPVGEYPIPNIKIRDIKLKSWWEE